jgi:cytochrome c oxidase assembly factor CtaG
VPTLAFAHVVSDEVAVPPSFGWTFEPWVVVLMTASIGLYMAGYLRLRARSQLGRFIRVRQLWAFAVGSLTLAIALNSPLDALAGALFSAHMVQHELLMILAAPLFVLGRPLAVWLWAFPSGVRPALGAVARTRSCRVIWRWLTHPVFAWLFHATALWTWHAPKLFGAALASPGVHTVQHTSFLLSALLFWCSILGEPARPVHGAGGDNGSRGAQAMLSLFTTMVHTGALGALLTLSPGVWYPAYIETASSLGFDPLQDQQLGGLVMWIPGGFAYLVAALVTGARWMMRRSPAPFAAPPVARPVKHGARTPQATRAPQDRSV